MQIVDDFSENFGIYGNRNFDEKYLSYSTLNTKDNSVN